MAEIPYSALTSLPDIHNNLKRTLYVGGLDDNVTKDILEAAFIPFGDIRTVAIPKDRLTGKHRGFGFIEYEEEEDAEQAIFNMHEAELYGRVLTVNLARTPTREPGKKYTPVWHDEAVLRQQYGTDTDDANTPSQGEDHILEALMKCSEAKEMMEKECLSPRRVEDASMS